jgi:hypothetical protein
MSEPVMEALLTLKKKSTSCAGPNRNRLLAPNGCLSRYTVLGEGAQLGGTINLKSSHLNDLGQMPWWEGYESAAPFLPGGSFRHCRQGAECVDQFHLLNRLAFRLLQSGTTEDQGQSLGAGNGDIDAVE